MPKLDSLTLWTPNWELHVRFTRLEVRLEMCTDGLVVRCEQTCTSHQQGRLVLHVSLTLGRLKRQARLGSAPALVFSRPAQRSLTLWSARSPSRLATLCTRGFSSLVASTAALIVTGWSEPVPGRVYPRCGPPPFTAHPVTRRNIKGRPFWSRVWVLASIPTERNALNG